MKEGALKDGANIVTAKFGDVEDTITLNGAAEHNQEYTLPNIAEAMAAGNWFNGRAERARKIEQTVK